MIKIIQKVVFYPFWLFGVFVLVFALQGCVPQPQSDYTKDFAYILNHIDSRRYAAASRYLDSIIGRGRAFAAADQQKAALLRFMIDYKQDKAIHTHSYIIQAHDYFEAHQEALPVYYRLSTFYAAAYYKSKGLDKTYVEYLQLAADIAAKAEDYSLAFKSYYNLGKYYYLQGRYPKAISLYKEAEVFAVKGHLYSKQAKILSNIGNNYLLQGKKDSALEQYNLALHIAQEYQDISCCATLLQNLGVAYGEKRAYGKAISYYQQALQASTANSQRGNVCVNIAGVYLKWHKADSAWHYLQQAKPLLEKGGTEDLYLLNWYYYTLSRYYIMAGKTEKALQNFSHFTSYYDSIVRLSKRAWECQAERPAPLQVAHGASRAWQIAFYIAIGILVLLLAWAYFWYKKHKGLVHTSVSDQLPLHHQFRLSLYQYEMDVNQHSTAAIDGIKKASQDKSFLADKHLKDYMDAFKQWQKHKQQDLSRAAHAYLTNCDFPPSFDEMLSDTDYIYLALLHIQATEKEQLYFTHSSSPGALKTRSHRIRRKLEEADITNKEISQWGI